MYLAEAGPHVFKELVQLDVAPGLAEGFLASLVPVVRIDLPTDCKLGLLACRGDSDVDGIFAIRDHVGLSRKESHYKKGFFHTLRI